MTEHTPTRLELIDLLKRNLERMQMINQRCTFKNLTDCPNHRLMFETEAAIRKAEGE